MESYEKRHKRFTLPDGHPIREFVMRELDGLDDIEIAAWVERKTTSITGGSYKQEMQLERIEAMRRAIVSVDGETVNVNGVPYAGFDRWPHRTRLHAHNAFNEMNGVSPAEQKKVQADAEDIRSGHEEIRSPPSAVRSVG